MLKKVNQVGSWAAVERVGSLRRGWLSSLVQSSIDFMVDVMILGSLSDVGVASIWSNKFQWSWLERVFWVAAAVAVRLWRGHTYERRRPRSQRRSKRWRSPKCLGVEDHYTYQYHFCSDGKWWYHYHYGTLWDPWVLRIPPRAPGRSKQSTAPWRWSVTAGQGLWRKCVNHQPLNLPANSGHHPVAGSHAILMASMCQEHTPQSHKGLRAPAHTSGRRSWGQNNIRRSQFNQAKLIEIFTPEHFHPCGQVSPAIKGAVTLR